MDFLSRNLHNGMESIIGVLLVLTTHTAITVLSPPRCSTLDDKRTTPARHDA